MNARIRKMPVSDKDHFDALRAADQRTVELLAIANQRAVELLAKANSDRIKTGMLIAALLVSISSVLVAIYSIIIKH